MDITRNQYFKGEITLSKIASNQGLIASKTVNS